MSQLVQFLLTAYPEGFLYLFTVPAAVVCAIVLFEVCASALAEFRERRRRARSGEAEALREFDGEAPLFHAEAPQTTLRKWHYRPLDRSLTQPFAKQVNRPVSDAYRWG